MRHKKLRHQLNRFSTWRKATLKSLAMSVLLHQSIKTTKARAAAVKPLVEKLITLGKDNTLAAKREAYRILGDHRLVSALFAELAPRFTKRIGGYTRILNLGKRRGDNAEMVILELTEIKKREIKKVKKEKAAHVTETNQPETVSEVQKHKTQTTVQEEQPPIVKKPPKKFLGGLRNIFRKERGPL
ncbi:MAG: 50S ribosomal protein L17 [Candidatus Omnitrophota bacterium]